MRLVTLSAVESWKSVSAGILQQSVGDDRVAGSFVEFLIQNVAWCHVLIPAALRQTTIFLTGYTRPTSHFCLQISQCDNL